MENNTSMDSDKSIRQKAEEILNLKPSKSASQLSVNEIQKLVHELEVHQIELEMQNEELQQANEQAENILKKYTELYEFAPTAYYTLNKEGEIIDLNLSGASILGKERKKLKNSRLGFFVSDNTKLIYNEFLEKLFNNKNKETCEVILSIKDKSPIYMCLTGVVIENGNQCLIIMNDITNLKLTEAELNQKNEQLILADADKNRFISILAHDLKSPFNALLGYLDLLSENLRTYNLDEIEKRLFIVNNSATGAFLLIDDILMWARSQSGKLPYDPEVYNFKNVCIDVVEILKPNAISKNIAINILIQHELTVFADIDMLKTILRNLVSNAIKFTKAGGYINIDAKKNNNIITISVSDNGMGIAPNAIVNLFDKQKTQTTNGTSNECGTGLGLVLCNDFVEKHGGKIWVESQLGKGSDFKFTMPAGKI